MNHKLTILVVASLGVMAAVLAIALRQPNTVSSESGDVTSPDVAGDIDSGAGTTPDPSSSAPLPRVALEPQDGDAIEPDGDPAVPSLEQTFEEKYADLEEAALVDLALKLREEFQAYMLQESERYVASGLAERIPAGEKAYSDGVVTDDAIPSLMNMEGGMYRFTLTRQESPGLFALYDEKKWLEARVWPR